jgi:hypothetical protein
VSNYKGGSHNINTYIAKMVLTATAALIRTFNAENAPEVSGADAGVASGTIADPANVGVVTPAQALSKLLA